MGHFFFLLVSIVDHCILGWVFFFWNFYWVLILRLINGELFRWVLTTGFMGFIVLMGWDIIIDRLRVWKCNFRWATNDNHWRFSRKLNNLLNLKNRIEIITFFHTHNLYWGCRRRRLAIIDSIIHLQIFHYKFGIIIK